MLVKNPQCGNDVSFVFADNNGASVSHNYFLNMFMNNLLFYFSKMSECC